LTEDNADMWSAIPGKENITILRNYSMFNFTNPDGALWLNETPEMVEFKSYLYQEK